MDMPAAAYMKCAARAALEFVEVVLVEVGVEADLMHMIPVAGRHGLTAHSCKTMVMRIGVPLCDLHTADDFVYVLLPAVAIARLAAACF